MMQHKSSPRKTTILQAALYCFTKYGVEATTIEMIREQSGASVGSLYHHFGNKEGIAAALYKEGLRQFGQQLHHALLDANSVESMLRCLIQANITWIVENPDWARFIFYQNKVLKAAGQEEAFKEDQKLANQTIYNAVKKLPDLNRLHILPLEMYYSIVIGPIHDYSKRWLNGAVNTSPHELVEDFIRIAIRSLVD